MQSQHLHGSRLIFMCSTAIAATAIVVVACGWVTLTSPAAKASDPNNILLDFSAKWCGPCQQMTPIVSKLERQGYPIRQVDVDREADLARRYKVESIPCFVLVSNGREVSRITGHTDEKKLISLMNMLPKSGADEPASDRAQLKNASLASNPKPGQKTGADDKKSLLKFPQLPHLFAKNQDAKLTPTDIPDTVRSQNPPAPSARTIDIAREALAASVRIRVKNGKHLHYGSGTVIDNQPDRAMILTCGHILRGLSKDAVIEVDVFSAGKSDPQTIVAEMVKCDLKSDVGLISIPGQKQLTSIRLATRTTPAVEDRVYSVGCGGGSRPAVQEHMIKAVNSIDGPENLECSGAPQEGRSGGGLFQGSELIGVCNFADYDVNSGIYRGLKPVIQLLETAKLGYLTLTPPAGGELAENEANSPGDAILGGAMAMNDNSPFDQDDLPTGLMRSAAAASLKDNDYVGAEIVCIISPKKPGGPKRIVIVNQASPRFVNDLLYESNGGRGADSTSTAKTGTNTRSKSRRTNAETLEKTDVRPNNRDTLAGLRSNRMDQPVETSFEAKRTRRSEN